MFVSFVLCGSDSRTVRGSDTKEVLKPNKVYDFDEVGPVIVLSRKHEIILSTLSVVAALFLLDPW